MFVEGIEKTDVRDFVFSLSSAESPRLAGSEEFREEECGSMDQRMTFWFILNEIWKSKMEISVEVTTLIELKEL